jgi:hypothetical protein
MKNATVSDTKVSFTKAAIIRKARAAEPVNQAGFRIRGWPAKIRADSTTLSQNSK